MTTTEAALRAAIARLGHLKKGRRYPEQVREQVARFARMRIAGGASMAAVCRQLDIGQPTLARFLDVPPEAGSFRQVVLAAPAVERVPRVVKFGGAVVEGLSLDEIAALLTRLTCSA